MKNYKKNKFRGFLITSDFAISKSQIRYPRNFTLLEMEVYRNPL